MNNQINNVDSDFEDDFDEHLFEISTSGRHPINWRRIELIKDQQMLRKQLEDFQDYD